MNIPEIIYHYTSYENFYQILSTGELHLCAPWNSQDPLEGEYHHKGLNKGKMMRYFTSFTEKFDSRLVWDAYGDKGKGVALGFKKDTLEKITETERNKWEKLVQDLTRKDCSEETNKEVDFIIPPIGGVLSDFVSIEKINYDPCISDHLKKAPFYSEEEEIRLQVTNYWIWFQYLEKRQIVPELKTKFINGKIIDYLPLNMMLKDNFLETIPEIILGPEFNNKNIHSLETFIQSHFNCSFKVQHLDPFGTDKKTLQLCSKENNELCIYFSRGHVKSIDKYRENSKQKSLSNN